MLILALVVIGAAAYTRLGVDRFPAVDIPQVRVRAVLPGAAPEEMETEVAQPLEEAVNTVEGLDELRSISGSGASFLAANFQLERDVDVAAQDVRDRVSAALVNLPPDLDPPVVAKFDNESSPVLTVALSSDLPLRELTDLADRVVKRQLERVRGVGEVVVVGGLERAINIWVDADRLAALGLPITTIRDAILRQNSQVPGGNVTTPTVESSLRTLGRVSDPAAFADLVLATRNGTPIRVRDVGRAEDGTKEQRSVARLDDVPTVILEVRRQSGANTVAVIEAAKKSLAALAGQLPPDVRLEIIRDQSRYIHAALHEITVHLVLGSVLACLVVLAFMRSWRSTLIAGIAIPTSVIATFACMWPLGFTLNSVTMLALVLMVGVVIDDAIVVLENIFRFVEEKRMEPMEAARAATAEIGLAVLATTLSLVVVFVPVSFMSSISGRFLYQFGITAAVGHPREPAGLVHADADHERPAPAPGGGRRGRHVARRALWPARRRVRADPGLGVAPPRAHRRPRRPGHRLDGAALRHDPPGIHSDGRRRGRVRPLDHPRPKAPAWRRWTRPCAPSPPTYAARAVSRPCSRPRAAASSAASTRATATCASHPTRRAIRRSRGSSPGCSTWTRWPRSAATSRSATSCRVCVRRSASIPICASPCAMPRRSIWAAPRWTSTSTCAGPT